MSYSDIELLPTAVNGIHENINSIYIWCKCLQRAMLVASVIEEEEERDEEDTDLAELRWSVKLRGAERHCF